MTKVRNFLVGLSVTLAILLPVYFLVAALGTKFGLFDWRIGFGLMVFQFALFVIGGVLAVGLIALGVSLFVTPRQHIGRALLALLVPALAFGWLVYAGMQAQKVPPIHDISTDLANPPAFSQAVIDARAKVAGVNSLDLLNKTIPTAPRFEAAGIAGKPVTALQMASYPEVQPLYLEMDTAAAVAKAEAAARKLGWTVGLVDAAGGRLEASQTSFWFGFTDDIAIRVVAADQPGMVRMDIRSVSRVGLSDLGANAKRIKAFRLEVSGAAQAK
jgi:uncharacterized protein (DUF1499 family)